MNDGSYKGAHLESRRAILQMLKLRGALTTSAMAESLSVSTMAVRQHLQEMEKADLVCSDEKISGVGRPSKLWKLTPSAEREHFPDGHRELSVDLIEGLVSELDEGGLERVLETRRQRQLLSYGTRMSKGHHLREKAEMLAAIRTEEGYMAEVEELDGGALGFAENHCPVCDAAAQCKVLCSNELLLFQELFGETVSVEREEHILEGSRRCFYRLEERSS